MGQKVHPHGFRLGVSKDWTSRWFATGRKFGQLVTDDFRLREFLMRRLSGASVSGVRIERPAGALNVTVLSARPGVVIGKKGEDIENLRKEIVKATAVDGNKVKLFVEEVRKPEIEPRLVAENIAQQLERRVMYRRAVKRALQSAMRAGAGGIKIAVAGRLNGAEIARSEWSREGRIPLHTLRADISYGFAEAKTGFGIIGVKVWVYQGEGA